jgi:hypothetical protein
VEVEDYSRYRQGNANDHPGHTVDPSARAADRPGYTWSEVAALVDRRACLVVKMDAADQSDNDADAREQP